MSVNGIKEQTIEVEGHNARYLTAGDGPPLVLLHGVGTSSGEWSWVLPDLARNNRVYAIDLPGYDGSYEPPDYAPAYTASFVKSFFDAVGVESAVVVGNSFGGLAALHLALSEPARVSALVLADSAGLDRAVNPALAAVTLPGRGDVAKVLAKTRLAAGQRAFSRALLMFARPWQIPPKWLKDQYKLAQLPNFMEATLESLRSAVNVAGQREVLLDRLPQLQMPTLVIWGIEDRLLPYSQAKEAIALIQDGSLKLIPNCGHLPHVEQPKQFVSTLGGFLSEQPR
ncbi:MAG TPA: alpha/beta fold hydrolase [Rubrobacteraceae bacterium]|nr:alpha/beta fold hydrolase [Rubrobacteraceae bacterium]